MTSMKRYANKSGKSGVVAYQIGDDNIGVKFIDGSVYEYDYSSAGKKNVEEMKILAAEGRGLSTYISQHVKEKYKMKY